MISTVLGLMTNKWMPTVVVAVVLGFFLLLCNLSLHTEREKNKVLSQQYQSTVARMLIQNEMIEKARADAAEKALKANKRVDEILKRKPTPVPGTIEELNKWLEQPY